MSYWSQFCQDFAGKRVLIFGLGLQGGGVQVANTFHNAGAEVRVSDLKTQDQLAESISQLHPTIHGTYGQQPAEDIVWADFILKNPAVPYEHPLIQQALTSGKPVIGEAALALHYIGSQTIAITGTRGKTTTTYLIHHFLEQAGYSVILAGNIPQSPLLPQLQQATPNDWFVVEIPSFQTESLVYTQASAHIAIITSLSADHLNRYPTQQDYVQAKTHLFRYQKSGDIAVYQTGQLWTETLEQSIPVDVQKMAVTPNDVQFVSEHFQTHLLGNHNRQNIALARAAVRSLKVSDQDIQAVLDSFTGVPFRQERVAEIDGIEFINDTTATTPTALNTALDTFAKRKVIIIAGGATKHLPLPVETAQKLASLPVGVVLLQGSGEQEIKQAWQQLGQSPGHLATAESLAQAVQTSFTWAKKFAADTILLSPGYASFEMFTNEFDRGQQFNQLVASLGKSESAT
jgi:UDP-N-acetylmuramoylalanine--D-glutamate ligase